MTIPFLWLKIWSTLNMWMNWFRKPCSKSRFQCDVIIFPGFNVRIYITCPFWDGIMNIFQSQLYWFIFLHLQHSPGTHLENWTKNLAYLCQCSCTHLTLILNFLSAISCFQISGSRSFFSGPESQFEIKNKKDINRNLGMKKNCQGREKLVIYSFSCLKTELIYFIINSASWGLTIYSFVNIPQSFIGINSLPYQVNHKFSEERSIISISTPL